MFFPCFLFAVRRAEPAAKRWRASAIGSPLAESPLVVFESRASGRDELAHAFLLYSCLNNAGQHDELATST